MKFTVVMPSRLVDYPSSASNKPDKLLRAIDSVVNQTFPDWELIVISDGCEETVRLVKENIDDSRIRLFTVTHGKLWSGLPRNEGIRNASGEWITYLDIDDIMGKNHLQKIDNGLGSYDWVWYNDIRYRPKKDLWYENYCDIFRMGKHGTSNITHKRSLNVWWPLNGKYAHDYHFVRELLHFKNFGKIETPEYIVCHIPGTPNTGGYDI